MFFKSTKYLFLIATIVCVSACGKTSEEKIYDATETANILLSTYQCQAAIDVLEGVGRQNKNAHYLKTLASAYACRANYSTVTFFGTDIAKTATPAPLGGMTTYTSSLTTFTSPLTTDAKFVDLQSAINILLYAGGIASTTEPTSIERAKYFSANQAADINTEMAFMMMVQLGRFMTVYADTNASGVKGGGSASNNCFTDYSNVSSVAVQTILANQLGACKVTNSPHAQLNSTLVSVANRRKRLCQGIVLLNNILDVLPSILVSAGGGDLDDMGSVTTDIAAAKTALEAVYSGGEVMTVLSQENCETSASITTETIESYYAAIFEALVQ